MARESSSEPRDGLSGSIERVTFHNEDTGFAVLRVKVKGRSELVTVVGQLPCVSPGEWITAQGQWVRDRDFGLQLKAESLHCAPPSSREGIEKYLGSGSVKGIGPVYARKLVEKFGEKIFDVIEQHSAKLEEIEGIGPGRRREIKQAWAAQRVVREIMVFLHSHGVGSSRAVRIYKFYGEAAIETVRANPYLLARDIPGIGFKTADQVAQKLGIPAGSILRARAGINHILGEGAAAGHCALPKSMLLDQTAELLSERRLPERETSAKEREFQSVIHEATARLLVDGGIIEEQIGGEALIFLPALKRAEEGIAEAILGVLARPSSHPPMDVDKAIAWAEARAKKTLAPSQRETVARSLASRLLVITGGPGVGKTTILNSLLLILRAKKVKALLCAPTGRAAKRMSEATGMEAMTIHRLLEYQSEGGFTRDAARPLNCDLLVVDEASMVDVPLMHRLLRALPERAHLILVGDVDQLPSVGPGMVLPHLIQSGIVPVSRLNEIFRQAASSRIITTAHSINQGGMPELVGNDADSDFHFIEREDPSAIQETVLECASVRIPNKLGCDSVRDVQVLCPMRRGSLGSMQFNLLLQARLNPLRKDEPTVERFGWQFRLRDKVMQIQNNYEKEVFNGDPGQITSIDSENRELVVAFDGRSVSYDFGELDEVSLAYAVTVHKAQGSEFPAVIVPLAMQHYMLLQRNLLYTALTRGKRMVVIVGQGKAWAAAIRNDQTTKRFSGLLHRLKLGS